MSEQKPTPQPNPMAVVVAGVKLVRERTSAHAEVDRIRAELAEATKRAEEFSDEARRKMIREQDRRALLAGRVILTVLSDDPEAWATFWPHLSTALEYATDSDRALYDLPAKPKKSEAKQIPQEKKPEGGKQKSEGGNQDEPPVPILNMNQGEPENQEQKKDENRETAIHT